jgi:hypothetical protein
MLEALNLFEETANLPYFTTTDCDFKSYLFKEKMTHTPITVFFKTCIGKNNFPKKDLNIKGFVENAFFIAVEYKITSP